MTMIQINISDDLKQAVERAFPNETAQQVIERLLRAAIKRSPPLTRDPGAVVAAFDRIRERTAPLANDGIRRLRHEGRK